MKNRMTILALTLVTVASCGIYGKYERPELDVKTEDTSVFVPGWRAMFKDPFLQDLIDTALACNTDLQVAFLKVEEARATLKTSRLSLLPSLNLTATAEPSSSGGSLNGDKKGRDDWGASITGNASWEVDAFARKTNAARGAYASLEQSQAYAQAVQVELIATVAEYYYNLLALDTQLEISEETLANWTESISVIEALKDAGRENDIAVLQAKARKLNLQASAAGIRGDITKAENALCSLLGVSPREIPRGTLEEQSLPSELLDGIPLGTVAGRPDVRQAEHALEQAFYTTNEARGSFFPTLTLSGTLGWTHDGGKISDPAAWIWNAIGSLAQPLFNAGTNAASLKIAKARQEEALLQFRQALLDAGKEVNDALAECQSAKEREDFDEKQCEALSETVDKIGLMMKYSTANYLEVLTANQSLLEARLSAAEDRHDLITSYVSLFKAIGGGVD